MTHVQYGAAAGRDRPRRAGVQPVRHAYQPAPAATTIAAITTNDLTFD
jgi:hypothetical protein